MLTASNDRRPVAATPGVVQTQARGASLPGAP